MATTMMAMPQLALYALGDCSSRHKIDITQHASTLRLAD